MITKHKINVSNSVLKRAIDEGDNYFQISECAYYKAEKRGFDTGHELEDWFAAEREINKQNFYKFRT